MKPYGPVQVTLNMPFQIGIDNTATTVQIHNNTGLSLRVFFGAAAPASPTYPSQWHATVDPGSHPVLPVNGQSYFDGTVSFYPYSVQGTQTQSAGVISASSYVSLEAYFPGETPPQSVYSPVFQQGAAQQRNVAVPMPSLASNLSSFTTLTQASTNPFLYANILIPANCNQLLAQNVAGGGGGVPFDFFLHDLDIRFEGTAAGYNAVAFAIEAALYDITLVTLKAGPQTMYLTELGNPGGVGASDRVTFTRSSPNPTVLNIPNGVSIVNGDALVIRFKRINTVGTWNVYPNIGWSVDAVNLSIIGAYGVVNTYNQLPTSPTNPQTY